jgi:hypothetical protein
MPETVFGETAAINVWSKSVSVRTKIAQMMPVGV